MILLRAHHGMCFAFFRGKGYSNAFTSHMWEVSQQLKSNPTVKVLNTCDTVCSACPNQVDGICTSPEKVQSYDDAVLSCCSLQAGAELSWEGFSHLVWECILLKNKRETICGDCQWSSICK